MIQIDMPMPDNCLECRFNTSEFGYCNAMPVEFVGQVSDFEEDGKPEWCPLKAQEPIAPVKVNRYIDTDENGHWFSPETYDCGNCGVELNGKANYCHICGQAVRWE